MQKRYFQHLMGIPYVLKATELHPSPLTHLKKRWIGAQTKTHLFFIIEMEGGGGGGGRLNFSFELSKIVAGMTLPLDRK